MEGSVLFAVVVDAVVEDLNGVRVVVVDDVSVREAEDCERVSTDVAVGVECAMVVDNLVVGVIIVGFLVVDFVVVCGEREVVVGLVVVGVLVVGFVVGLEVVGEMVYSKVVVG